MDPDFLKVTPENFNVLNDFFKLAARLKTIPRQGWKDKLDIQNPESVSDHCYSMSIMAMVIGDSMNLDTKKMIKMSLLHDFAESILGDITPEMINKKEKEYQENKTMDEIFQCLPSNLKDDYFALWKEYERNETQEAIILHEIDKLELVLQAAIYSQKGFPKERLQVFIDSAVAEINNSYLKGILKIILDDLND